MLVDGHSFFWPVSCNGRGRDGNYLPPCRDPYMRDYRIRLLPWVRAPPMILKVVSDFFMD